MSRSSLPDTPQPPDRILTDSVTGLPDYEIFLDRLDQAITYLSRYGGSLAVLVADVDDFDLINAAVGRQLGDRLLHALGNRLRVLVRKSDSVTRVLANTFAIGLRNFGEPADLSRIAQKLLAAIGTPLEIGGREFCLAASVGISVFPKDGSDTRELMQTAEAAMRDVKRHGKNGFQFFTEELAARASERLEIEGQLRRAIAKDEFEVHYQPKIDVETGALVSAEALVRWCHPSKGVLLPGSFIPIAEATGLIVDIGKRVGEIACKDARQWPSAGGSPVSLAINLSLRQLERSDLVETLMATLVAANFDSELLEVEITESLFLRDPRYVQGVLERLRELGISVAIDDFGTGYSSLSQLCRLPIDTLKIDRGFVSGVGSDADSLVIVEAITRLGRNLGMTVVAEGVETVEQLEFLREIGCHQCQGYLFSKPIPASQFTDYIVEHHTRRGPRLRARETASNVRAAGRSTE